MDAVEYVKALRRLCRSKIKCSECQLLNKEEHCCMADIGECAEKTVQIVEQWAKDHPIRTRQSEFLNLHPDARIDNCGILDIRPCCIEVSLCGKCDLRNCDNCRRGYWLAEVTDND